MLKAIDIIFNIVMVSFTALLLVGLSLKDGIIGFFIAVGYLTTCFAIFIGFMIIVEVIINGWPATKNKIFEDS